MYELVLATGARAAPHHSRGDKRLCGELYRVYVAGKYMQCIVIASYYKPNKGNLGPGESLQLSYDALETLDL